MGNCTATNKVAHLVSNYAFGTDPWMVSDRLSVCLSDWDRDWLPAKSKNYLINCQLTIRLTVKNCCIWLGKLSVFKRNWLNIGQVWRITNWPSNWETDWLINWWIGEFNCLGDGLSAWLTSIVWITDKLTDRLTNHGLTLHSATIWMTKDHSS